MTRASFTGAFDESCLEIYRKHDNTWKTERTIDLNVNDEHELVALCG